MKNPALQAIKDELALIMTRIENTEGYFDNFDTTLNNHMNDYNKKLDDLHRWFSWAFWILFTLTLAAIAGTLSLAAILVQWAVGG